MKMLNTKVQTKLCLCKNCNVKNPVPVVEAKYCNILPNSFFSINFITFIDDDFYFGTLDDRS